MSKSEDCLFCKIIDGRIPSEKVYEDDTTYAFKDINPKAKVHVLIVPKDHYANVAELAAADPAELAISSGSLRASPTRSSRARTVWCSTPASTPGRPCSTCTRMCSPARSSTSRAIRDNDDPYHHHPVAA